jgi:hypothetical protein
MCQDPHTEFTTKRINRNEVTQKDEERFYNDPIELP